MQECGRPPPVRPPPVIRLTSTAPRPPAANPWLAATDAPPIPAAKAWAAAYDGAAGPFLDLSQAAPGEAPPASLLEALGAAAADPDTARYGPIAGEPALRRALADDMAAVYGAAVDPDTIAITSGCNQAFFAAMLTLARAGDEVVVPAPWYFNHKMILDMLGITVRLLPCRPEAGFVPDPAAARALIGPATRAIVLVTPNNPTGATYPADTIAAFAALAAEAGIALVLDETYRDFMPDGQDRPHGLFAVPDLAASLVHLYSFSKSYAIPGHRLGALLAPQHLMREVGKVQDSLQICAPRAGQIALVPAIPGLKAWREANRRRINRRAGMFAAEIAGLDGWRIDSVGAYFAYLRHPGGETALAAAERLCRTRGVLTLPGSWFGPGQEGHLRVAFANIAEDRIGGLAARFAD